MATGFLAETERDSRTYKCGWAPRSEDASDLARQLQALEGRLETVDAAYGSFWPLLAARAIRPGRDPGPLREIPTEELARLLDRRARFDPPRLPAPVGPAGYRVVLGNNRTGYDPLNLNVRASACSLGFLNANCIEVSAHESNHCWRDEAMTRQILDILISVFDPDWAWAGAYVYDESVGISRERPWLYWRGPRADLAMDAPRQLDGPVHVDAHGRGELLVWP